MNIKIKEQSTLTQYAFYFLQINKMASFKAWFCVSHGIKKKKRDMQHIYKWGKLLLLNIIKTLTQLKNETTTVAQSWVWAKDVSIYVQLKN